MQLVEGLQSDFGGIVEPVTFTNATKLALGEGLRIQMESRNFTHPDVTSDEDDEDDEIAGCRGSGWVLRGERISSV